MRAFGSRTVGLPAIGWRLRTVPSESNPDRCCLGGERMPKLPDWISLGVGANAGGQPVGRYRQSKTVRRRASAVSGCAGCQACSFFHPVRFRDRKFLARGIRDRQSQHFQPGCIRGPGPRVLRGDCAAGTSKTRWSPSCSRAESASSKWP